MIVVRGLNMFPAMIAGVIHQFAELSGEYRIVLDRPPPYDVLPIEAELAVGQALNPLLAGAIEGKLKTILGASTRITLLPPNSLPRTEGKTRRVIRTYT